MQRRRTARTAILCIETIGMIYVGIVTYNSIADLPGCLAGLRAQTCSGMQVLALDNASPDGSASWLQEYAPEVRLTHGTENIGYGRAHNRLIQEADLRPGDYYMALNPDAELQPEYVSAIVRQLDEKSEFGWGVGKLLMKDEAAQPTGLVYSMGHGLLKSGFAFNIGYGLPEDDLVTGSREVFGAPGAAVVYKADLIRDLSDDGAFFDPAMFLYAEDSDVDWRARRLGWRCWYVEGAAGYHRGSNPGGVLKMTSISNRYLSVLKNAALFDLLTYNLPLIAGHCLLRLVISPRLGMVLTAGLLRRGSSGLRRRKRARLSRAQMTEWFRWSAKQPTLQRSGLSRLGHSPRRA